MDYFWLIGKIGYIEMKYILLLETEEIASIVKALENSGITVNAVGEVKAQPKRIGLAGLTIQEIWVKKEEELVDSGIRNIPIKMTMDIAPLPHGASWEIAKQSKKI